MDIINEKDFLRANDIVANKKVARILCLTILGGPLISLGVKFNFFETSYSFCLLITLIAFAEGLIDWLLCKKEKYCELTKYFGLVSVAVLIGLMATQFSVGVYICYIFIPLVSCMYLDCKLTVNISIVCYGIMIAALYFRSYGAVVNNFSNYTYKQWFISQSLGYTIEYGICTCALYSLTRYLRDIVRRYYEASVEKIDSSQTDRVKSVFIKNMSSELKETLDQVDTLTKELMDDEIICQRGKEKIRVIANTNRMMRSRIQDMSDFSRIDLTKRQTTVRKYRLTSLIHEIEAAMKIRIGDKPIDFNILVNPTVPNELIGDKVRIRQVLINLLGDSVKVQEEGFVILKLDWKQKDNMAVLYIDVLDNSYDERVEEAKEANSTFSICKDLCEYMNGHIEISSDYDKGSGFSIELPQMIASEKIVYGDINM